MPQEGMRHKKPRHFEILIVSTGDDAKTRTFRGSALRVWSLGIVVFLVCAGVTLAALIFTPVAMFVPIPNPVLERKYGHQLVATQERLNSLAEDVLVLRDYNMQLRKALGEDSTRNTASTPDHSPVVAADADRRTAPSDQDYQPQAPAGGVPDGSALGDEESGLPSYNTEVAGNENFQARFPLALPTGGIVTQGFDPSRSHFGMDFAGKLGTPVYAAAEGYIVFAGWTYDDGNMVMISHGGGYMSVYKHAQALLRTAREFVRRGEPIALLGTSGKTSLGPHLHFEVWKDGMAQDPNDYLMTPQRIP